MAGGKRSMRGSKGNNNGSPSLPAKYIKIALVLGSSAASAVTTNRKPRSQEPGKNNNQVDINFSYSDSESSSPSSTSTPVSKNSVIHPPKSDNSELTSKSETQT